MQQQIVFSPVKENFTIDFVQTFKPKNPAEYRSTKCMSFDAYGRYQFEKEWDFVEFLNKK